MNWCSIHRIHIARKLVKELISKSDEEILAVFISSSVTLNKANKNSNINIHVILENINSIKHEYELINKIVVEWIYEPLKNYQNYEEINKNYLIPYNIYTSIVLYDPKKWLLNLKTSFTNNIFNKDNINLRVNNLWSLTEGVYNELENINDFEEFLEYYKMILLPSMLIPVVATAQIPNKRTLLIQVEKTLKKLGYGKSQQLFFEMIGCHDITKKEALFYLDNLMEMYDFCIEVQSADYHGVNKDKRDYTFKTLYNMINKGKYKEAIYPILEWMWIIDYRITSDVGDTGWWSMMAKALEQRLELTKSLWKKRKKAILKIHDFLKNNIIDKKLAVPFKKY